MGPTPIVFSDTGVLVFQYADLAGVFQTTSRRFSVPAASRSAVRVIDPTAKNVAAGHDDRVQLADLRLADAAGQYTTRLIPEAQFQRLALAALPPGAASRVSLPRAAGDPAPTPAGTHQRIVLYGTSWCGACKEARAFLRALKLPFVDKNVERDPVSAAQLALELKSLGVVPDRVPVIDVRGRVLVGFDPIRIRTLIGEQI